MRTIGVKWSLMLMAGGVLVAALLVSGCLCPGQKTVTPTPSPASSPSPILYAQLSGWATDKDVYARGETATGRVNVTNMGNATIDEVDFTVDMHRTILFQDIVKTFRHSETGLGIRPGETRQVQFSVAIPAEYSGISTAGDYRLVATATVGGITYPAFTKAIRIT